MDKVEAIRHAAPIRMRPVLMTALAMIFGVLPAAFGVGPGAETRAPMAIATAAGMFSSTLLTLLVVPVFYLAFDDAAEWVKRKLRRRSPRPGHAVARDRQLDPSLPHSPRHLHGGRPLRVARNSGSIEVKRIARLLGFTFAAVALLAAQPARAVLTGPRA